MIRSSCLALCAIFLQAGSTYAQSRPEDLKSLVIETGRSKEPRFTLSGPDTWQQLLATAKDGAGRLWDLTRNVSWDADPPGIVHIDASGLVTPLAEGKATIEAMGPDDLTATIEVEVKDLKVEPRVSFAGQIVPILTRLGCNSGSCHGKTGGQNGFQLSLFGFEPGDDYSYLRESRSRRILRGSPEHSLLLVKATGTVAHAGGRRLDPESAHYSLMKRWIVQGTPPDAATAPRVTGIEIMPRERLVAQKGGQQLIVIAKLSDGSTLDVTRLAQFEVNEATLGQVSINGLFKAKTQAGAVAVMARYQTHVATFEALIPLGKKVTTLPPARNFVDELAAKRWKSLGLPPSTECDDATFLRRVTLDIAGRLPTPEETNAFLENKSAKRHEELVDRLLASPDYAYYFAAKWSAVLRNRRKSDKDDPKITQAFHTWVKDSLHENKPFDRFVRELLTVTGKHDEKPQVAWYREVNKINDQVEDVAQLFLGQRITCARCHHHPFEKWSQEDYWGLAAFFARVEFKEPPPPKKEKGAKVAPPKPPMEVLHKTGLAEALNPRTGKMVRPTGLGGRTLTIAPDADPRPLLVDWMTSPDNPYFARALANRYWKHFFGRGLVEPEDDLRITNPATDNELLDELAKQFVKSGYDLKKLVRLICTSSVYRLSSEPNEHNLHDRWSFSRFQPRRLPAEVLLDAIDDVVLIRSKFKNAPAGTRAVYLPDNQADSYFLSAFGRPDFASACECERTGDASLAQSLHLVNNKGLMEKISKGRAAKMAKETRPHAERIRDLYLTAFSREPIAKELAVAVDYVERRSSNVLGAYEDLVWTILNTKEFLFNH